MSNPFQVILYKKPHEGHGIAKPLWYEKWISSHVLSTVGGKVMWTKRITDPFIGKSQMTGKIRPFFPFSLEAFPSSRQTYKQMHG